LDVEPQKPHQEIGAAVQMGASVAVLPFVNMSPEPELVSRSIRAAR
jgi:TolB-like protein